MIAGRIRASLGQALPAWDDYFYQKPGFDSSAGMSVSPESSMRLSAVFSCIRVRSESLASAPLIIYKHLPNGGRERATDHPLYSVLHDRPNLWQTSLEWIEMMQAHLDLRGNAFSRIVPGPRGAIDQLIPLHPDLVQVYRLPSGRLKYAVRSRFNAEIDWYTQDEIFHLRGLSSDGLVGLSPIALQREVVGTGLAMDDYQGRFFQNGARPSGILEYPGRFKDDSARKKFRESWTEAQVHENQHRVAVLEDGMKYTAIGVSNADAEFLNSKKLTREEIAGMYRVPPHKIGIMERSTNNNIEHQGIEFVTDCMRPIAVRWEQRVNNDLIEPLELGEGNEYFAEFLLDGLLRGDMKSRYDAYMVGRNGGWLCPNDVCKLENLNPIPPEKGGDDYLRAVNYQVAGAPDPQLALPGAPGSPDMPDNPTDTADDTGSEGKDAPQDPPKNAIAAATIPVNSEAPTPEKLKLLHAFATEAGRRIVRKEVTALRKSLARAGTDVSAFIEDAKEFYESHDVFVAQTMCIEPADAKQYVQVNRNLIAGVHADRGELSCVIDWIEDTAAETLADLAVGRPEAEAPKLAAVRTAAEQPKLSEGAARQDIHISISPSIVMPETSQPQPVVTEIRSARKTGTVRRNSDNSMSFEITEE